MSYTDLFRYYGRPSDEARISITGFLQHPDKLTTDRIKQYDDTAARIIKEAQETISALQDYRRALADRYAALSTAPYKLRLELERRHEGFRPSKIYYYVRIRKIYEDGTEIVEQSERFTGAERRKAIARFETLKKERAGIEILKNIEKRA